MAHKRLNDKEEVKREFVKHYIEVGDTLEKVLNIDHIPLSDRVRIKQTVDTCMAGIKYVLAKLD